MVQGNEKQIEKFDGQLGDNQESLRDSVEMIFKELTLHFGIGWRKQNAIDDSDALDYWVDELTERRFKGQDVLEGLRILKENYKDEFPPNFARFISSCDRAKEEFKKKWREKHYLKQQEHLEIMGLQDNERSWSSLHFSILSPESEKRREQRDWLIDDKEKQNQFDSEWEKQTDEKREEIYSLARVYIIADGDFEMDYKISDLGLLLECCRIFHAYGFDFQKPIIEKKLLMEKRKKEQEEYSREIKKRQEEAREHNKNVKLVWEDNRNRFD